MIQKNKPQILNPNLDEDYHVHSLNFSDGMNTVDEMVQFAGKIGLKKLYFADHAQIGNRQYLSFRNFINTWKNVHNDVQVGFIVEADVINKDGKVCASIGGIESERFLLSFHPWRYDDNLKTATDALCKAIKMYKDRIICVAHLHSHKNDKLIDVQQVVRVANECDVAVELNGNYLRDKICEQRARILCDYANKILINSDAHHLVQLRDNKKKAMDFLQENGYL
ncbi:MAG: PHP domain-containing protein [Candidatus Nanoarchaeia archaeon]